MSRCCELTGKSVLFGNSVSHSNVKTRRKYKPNIQKKSLYSDLLGTTFTFRVSTSGIRTVEASGGIDNFLLSHDDKKLSLKAQKVRKIIINFKNKV